MRSRGRRTRGQATSPPTWLAKLGIGGAIDAVAGTDPQRPVARSPLAIASSPGTPTTSRSLADQDERHLEPRQPEPQRAHEFDARGGGMSDVPGQLLEFKWRDIHPPTTGFRRRSRTTRQLPRSDRARRRARRSDRTPADRAPRAGSVPQRSRLQNREPGTALPHTFRLFLVAFTTRTSGILQHRARRDPENPDKAEFRVSEHPRRRGTSRRRGIESPSTTRSSSRTSSRGCRQRGGTSRSTSIADRLRSTRTRGFRRTCERSRSTTASRRSRRRSGSDPRRSFQRVGTSTTSPSRAFQDAVLRLRDNTAADRHVVRAG